MANYFDKFDPPSPAQTPLSAGANPFDQFDPPSNGRTIARRGGKASGLFDDIPTASTGRARRGGLFDDIPMAGQGAMSGPYDYLLPQATASQNDSSGRQAHPDPYDYLRVKQPVGGAPVRVKNAFDDLFPDSAAPSAAKANAFDDLFPDDKPAASVRTMSPEEMKAMQPTPTVDRGSSIMDKIDAAVRGIADTATFGMADRIAAGLGSLTGIGGTAGDYSGNLARERAIDQADEIKNPALRIAGQLVGGLTFPVGAAAEGATLAGRAALGAGAGALQGGLYGAGSSEDLTNLPDVAKNAATGAALGGTIGAAAPAALSGVGRVARGADSIVRGVANPDRLAASRVANALARDAGKSQFDEAVMRTAQDAGQPMIVADMGGQATQDLARSAANTSPEARQALHDVTDARFETQSPRIAEFVSGLGGGSNATTTLEKLQAAAKAANRPAYAKAFAEGANGIWNDQLAGLMQAPAVQDAVRGAIKTGANRSVAEGFRPVKSPFDLGADGTIVPRVNSDGSRAIPSLQFWDGVKHNLDDTVGRLMRSGEKSAAADAIALRSQLVDALDAASPSYAKARGTAAQFFGAQDAVEAGAKFVADRRPNAEVARAISKMSAPEKQLFAHGFASALADKIEKVPDRRSVLNSIFNSPATRQRVTMALGPDKATKLEAYLNTEAAMDAVRKALGNSTTARQLASLGMAGGLGGVGGTVDYLHGGSFTTGVLAGVALEHLARQGTLKIDQRIAHSVGRMLASSNPADYKTVLALAAKSKRVADVIHALTPRAVAAVLPAALDELRQKRPAQGGRQTPSGVMPDKVARASLGLR